MNPPTPYPASARSKSKSQNEFRETAFREINARANTISKSAQDPFTGIKKMELEQTGKGGSKTPNASRRYSVASKFAGPKADNFNNVSNALQSKPMLNKRASLQAVTNEPQIHGASTQIGPTLSKSTAALSSKISAKATTTSSQGSIPGALHRRQSLASGQSTKPHKPCADLFKRPALGCGKADSTQTNSNKSRGMLLKSACYWVEQVKLAEMLEKHSVSIGFFRLAVECGAEPIDLLKVELIAFVERYSVWSDTIQQLLRCYGVTPEDQEALASRLAVSHMKQSSPCATHNCNFSADKEPGDQVCQELKKSLDQDFTGAMEKDPAGGTTEEEAPTADEQPVLGLITNLDAESITREVVSCIMSSLNHNDGCSNCNNDKYLQSKTDLPTKSSEQKDHSGVSANCPVSIAESISDPNSAFQEEATSSESLPSLKVWNLMPTATSPSIPAGQEVIISLDSDLNDSTSTSRISGEEMCVSMELVDTLSDDLRSSDPALSSAESNFQATQTITEVQENLLEDLEATTNSGETVISCETHMDLPQSSTHNKIQNNASGNVLISKRRGNDSRDNISKNMSMKTKTELPVLPAPNEPRIQGNRRTSHGSNERNSNMKEKSAPVSDTTTAESPASSSDKAAPSATLQSRRPSVLTPRSSTIAQRHNLDTISRTRSKGRISQHTEQGNEALQMQLTTPVTELAGIVATPRQDGKAEEGDGTKQDFLRIVDGTGIRAINDTDLMVTPGSAGVRRSARLIKPVGVSTPNSVSTPHLLGRLGTPRQA
ncbi:hypothetical protein GOP47_0027403 [Adiantum capillus-veneris]|nr:hypothetical protein GOP47_0027403 [Adiantum capillus-veneris]